MISFFPPSRYGSEGNVLTAVTGSCVNAGSLRCRHSRLPVFCRAKEASTFANPHAELTTQNHASDALEAAAPKTAGKPHIFHVGINSMQQKTWLVGNNHGKAFSVPHLIKIFRQGIGDKVSFVRFLMSVDTIWQNLPVIGPGRLLLRPARTFIDSRPSRGGTMRQACRYHRPMPVLCCAISHLRKVARQRAQTRLALYSSVRAPRFAPTLSHAISDFTRK